MRQASGSPSLRLALAGMVALGVVSAVLGWATQLPWLGLRLRWDAEAGAARVVHAEGPARAVPPGALLRAVSSGTRAVVLSAQDFTQEPDASIASYRGYAEFIRRQQSLYALQSSAQLAFQDLDQRVYSVVPASARPLASLPHEFWIQLAVGSFAFLIAAGVWAFRGRELSARYLLLSGFSTLIFSPFAGVYSTRELALPGGLFLWLSDANFCGGCVYCATMVAVLWHYPRRLGSWRVSAAVVLAYALWFVAQELGAFESMIVARRYPVFVAVLATFALSAVQYRVTRADPVSRAALSWFLLSWLLGTSLFVAITMVPQLFGVNTAALQGYGFLLFLLVYGGLAFGILRFRLFELGQWWFRTFAWIAGALLLFAVDVAVAWAFALPDGQTLGLALLICGFLWLPLRSFAWTRLIGARQASEPDLFRRVVQVAFASGEEARTRAWRTLARELFDPLQLEPIRDAPSEVLIEGDGLQLCVPAVGASSGLRLAYAGRGRRLFAPRDQTLMRQAVSMLRYVDESREAYNQGAREERSRIARDLHDDIGSRLLTGLHQSQLEQTKASISQALVEMRTILHGVSGHRLSLEHIVAELRHETQKRLEAAGIALDWPLSELSDRELSYVAYKHYMSIMRELVSNVVRHAGASALRVSVRCEGDQLVSELSDDGIGFDDEQQTQGYGLANARRRLSELGGVLQHRRAERGTQVRVAIQLASLVGDVEPSALSAAAEEA